MGNQSLAGCSARVRTATATFPERLLARVRSRQEQQVGEDFVHLGDKRRLLLLRRVVLWLGRELVGYVRGDDGGHAAGQSTRCTADGCRCEIGADAALDLTSSDRMRF